MGRRIEYEAGTVITVDEVAEQARIDADDLQDGHVEHVVIPAVIALAEELTGAAIAPAVYEDEWPETYPSGHPLDTGQARDVLSISRVEDSGDLQTLEVSTRLQVGRHESYLHFPGGRPAGRLVIRYRAQTDLAAHPSVRLWLLMHAATAYLNRETLVPGQVLHELPHLVGMIAGIKVPPRF